MRISKIPPKEELEPYVKNKKVAAEKFGVTEKTIIRWLKVYHLYAPTANYGCNKLDLGKAREIRRLSGEGKTKKELAILFDVTFSSISRILHNLTYTETKESAEVKVIYNIPVS